MQFFLLLFPGKFVLFNKVTDIIIFLFFYLKYFTDIFNKVCIIILYMFQKVNDYVTFVTERNDNRKKWLKNIINCLESIKNENIVLHKDIWSIKEVIPSNCYWRVLFILRCTKRIVIFSFKIITYPKKLTYINSLMNYILNKCFKIDFVFMAHCNALNNAGKVYV